MQNLILSLCAAIPVLAPLDTTSESFLFDETRVYIGVFDGYLLLVKPYLPLVVADQSLAFVDDYYAAYQVLYAAKKDVLSAVAADYPSVCGYHGSYKALLGHLGLGSCLKSTLLYLPPFGTFFCMEVLDLLGRAPIQTEQTRIVGEDLCARCTRCATACPGGAIGKDGTFDAARCLRSRQFEFANLSDGLATRAMGNRVLGCNTCQFVCPKNAPLAARHRIPDDTYRAMFDLDTFLAACVAPRFRETEYAKIVGYNFAKPMKLLSFVLSAMLAHNPQAHVPAVRAALTAADPNAKPLLRQYLVIAEEGHAHSTL